MPVTDRNRQETEKPESAHIHVSYIGRYIILVVGRHSLFPNLIASRDAEEPGYWAFHITKGEIVYFGLSQV